MKYFAESLFLGIAVVSMSFAAGGCMSRVEHATFCDGLDRTTANIRAEHREWAEALANDPSKLPQLHDGETPAEREAWLSVREGWHVQYGEFMNASRGNDGQ